MRRRKTVSFVGVLACVLLSAVGHAGDRDTRTKDGWWNGGDERSEILGCNNFSTMVSGNVSDSSLVGSGPGDGESNRTSSALGGISVSIYRFNGQSWIQEARVFSAADGHFEICDVPYATYRVEFCHPDFELEFWNNKSTFSESNGVLINSLHKQATGINAVLVPGTGPSNCP